VRRARRALRVAGLKLVWVAVSLGLLISTLVEYTQPSPSRFTPVFGVIWVAFTVWIYRTIRRARMEAP
jgi:hypothetical protein